MLGPIAAVTLSTPDVDVAVAAYERYLDYRVTARGPLSAGIAASWGTPGMAGRDCALLSPASSADFRLRFVAAGAAVPYTPFRHLGWNAAEFIVEDVDALAERLADSAFRIMGPPADLSFSDQIRAMQVRGPADEVLYLTQIKGKLPELDTPDSACAVDRAFIVILGGRSLELLQDFYGSRFAIPRGSPLDAVITVISNAYQLPPRQLHRLVALPLRGACYIEVDAMPPEVQPRPVAAGELPPAIAMVSFRCQQLSAGLQYLSEPVALADEPYRGRRSAVCAGAAAELLELIED
jgi:hypothetical protein